MPAIEVIPIDELVIDDSIDPRLTERSESRIQEYADNVDNLPPILVDSERRILDGIHRYKAHLLAEKDEIRVQSVKADTRQKALIYAAKYNSRHGENLKPKELKKIAIELFMEKASDEAIAEAISRSTATVHSYLKDAKAEWKSWAMQSVATLSEEGGRTQAQIAQEVSDNGVRRISQETVSEWLRKMREAEEEAANEESEDEYPEERAEEAEQAVESTASLDDSPEAEEPREAPAPEIDNTVQAPKVSAPRAPVSPTSTRTFDSVESFIEDEEIDEDAEEELGGHDIPDIEIDDSEVEAAAPAPKKKVDWNLFKNDTFIREMEDMGELDEVHMDVVNAIGIRDEAVHLYCGDEIEAFLGINWEHSFIRAELR